MVKPRSSQNRTVEFTQSEVDQMEKVLRDNEGLPFDENHYQSMAQKFNLDSRRAGKDVLHWKKVQSWFEDKQQHKKADGTAPTYAIEVDSDSSPERVSPKNDPAVLVGEDLPGLDELEFEARSGKDGAWYDVAAFIAHRVLESGEPEVRVRFVGFGAAEDEWVNVKRAVRQRSLPLESSECFRVNPGAHVLCFRERKDQAVYFDAHVVEVEKKRHDIRGCRCRFLVHYMHDQSEDIVSLRRLCLRPPK